MKPEQITETLEQAAEQLGIRVRYEAMTGDTAGSGGLCKVRGREELIHDPRFATPRERVQVHASEPKRVRGLHC